MTTRYYLTSEEGRLLTVCDTPAQAAEARKSLNAAEVIPIEDINPNWAKLLALESKTSTVVTLDIPEGAKAPESIARFVELAEQEYPFTIHQIMPEKLLIRWSDPKANTRIRRALAEIKYKSDWVIGKDGKARGWEAWQ